MSCELWVAVHSFFEPIKFYQMKNYKDLEIYKMAFRLAMEVHQMTMKLPNYELY